MKLPKKPFFKKPSTSSVNEYVSRLISSPASSDNITSNFVNKRGDVVTAQDLEKWKEIAY